MENRKALIVIILLVILGGIIWYSRIQEQRRLPSGPIPLRDSNGYESLEFGISFRYFKTYFLEEINLGNGERRHKEVVLTEDTEENRAVREGRAPGREGPVAISFDFYQNNLDQTSIEKWVEGTNDSNYKLAKGPYTETTLAGKRALSYPWSGLYEADTYVLSHKDNMVMISVTYLDPNDQIRKDFTRILETIRFD